MLSRRNAIIIAMLALCGCGADLRVVEVEGIARGATGGMVYLALWRDGQGSNVDSCRVGASGSFTLTCQVDVCELAELRFERSVGPIALVLHPGDRIGLTITPGGAELRGSSESAQLLAIERSLSVYNDELMGLAALPDSAAPLRQQRADSIVGLAQGLLRSYIDDNPYSLTAMLLLNLPMDGGGRLMGYAEHRDAYRKVARCLGEVYPDRPDVVRFGDMVRKLELYHGAALSGPSLRPGDMMPTLRVPLSDSSEIQLPGSPARLVLLDFAARWGEAAGGEADLTALFERYRGRGLELIQVVSTLDAQPLNDTVPWLRTVVGNPQEYSIFSQLNIVELPCNFLIDRQGRLLARDVYGDELMQLVERSLPRPPRPMPDTIGRRAEPMLAMPRLGPVHPVVNPES